MPLAKSDFSGVNLLGNAYEEEEQGYETVFNKIFKKHAGIDHNEDDQKKKESNRISFAGFASEDIEEENEKNQCSSL